MFALDYSAVWKGVSDVSEESAASIVTRLEVETAHIQNTSSFQSMISMINLLKYIRQILLYEADSL
jgi:hypothetical protein